MAIDDCFLLCDFKQTYTEREGEKSPPDINGQIAKQKTIMSTSPFHWITLNYVLNDNVDETQRQSASTTSPTKIIELWKSRKCVWGIAYGRRPGGMCVNVHSIRFAAHSAEWFFGQRMRYALAGRQPNWTKATQRNCQQRNVQMRKYAWEHGGHRRQTIKYSERLVKFQQELPLHCARVSKRIKARNGHRVRARA